MFQASCCPITSTKIHKNWFRRTRNKSGNTQTKKMINEAMKKNSWKILAFGQTSLTGGWSCGLVRIVPPPSGPDSFIWSVDHNRIVILMFCSPVPKMLLLPPVVSLQHFAAVIHKFLQCNSNGHNYLNEVKINIFITSITIEIFLNEWMICMILP